MQFFLYEIVARAVAIYLFFDCWHMVQHGLAERKIAYVNTDFFHLLFSGWSERVVHRDAAPVWYWMLIVGEIFSLLACGIVSIFGWWIPNS